jgi:hypothetical protein
MHNLDEVNTYIKLIKKVSQSRNHKIKNSYGIYDGYKYYRKIKPKESKYILSESQYFAITRLINSMLRDSLSLGDDVYFPCLMGKLEIRKNEKKVTIKDGKVKTNTPVDWNRTLKLWYQDEESYKNKKLIKTENKEIFKVYYNRSIAKYNNKSFYEFKINRELKNKITNNIKEGKLDAFYINI